MEQHLEELKSRLDILVGRLDLEARRKKLRELEAESLKPEFWQDNQHAQHVMREIDGLREDIEATEVLQKQIEDTLSVASEESLQPEVEIATREIRHKIEQLETKTFLSGEYDTADALLSIHAGQGGTEAMDWSQMLERMYMRYAERQEWKVEVLDEIKGEEAGVKSVILLISGKHAYGYLKGEAGTHRLVRQSPFNADNLRQTSFALVEVLPQIEENHEIEIKEENLDWQFYRSGGHGGQNVNKVSTAVRLTHAPTGIVVTAQTERFQEKNREIALNLLRAKLWAREEAEKESNVKQLKGEYRPAAWGTQIRSYVLHPYKMVKDLRTDVETSDTEAVLDGDLDSFIGANLTA
ncbi:MAG: peptide chain release factor 2 [Candidatus Blackburnbacteria bacterium RIFCSPHIGHO2_01_FULL_43_15b]|uniref:Peptide chain release factor 2 n=1 Tax=Candidatus Blackburnbacteria bacterium RIFCSPHIGHO2_01_FULL_43_15b TaxID=1797513 RepID=A0A1G1V042_9BACT|nr:MAG: peptide chain release factor 2 [Candidatus Blackburnbacteria bacterium RIFCSPHIGHO2_01_FULL_43_15b]